MRQLAGQPGANCTTPTYHNEACSGGAAGRESSSIPMSSFKTKKAIAVQSDNESIESIMGAPGMVLESGSDYLTNCKREILDSFITRKASKDNYVLDVPFLVFTSTAAQPPAASLASLRFVMSG